MVVRLVGGNDKNKTRVPPETQGCYPMTGHLPSLSPLSLPTPVLVLYGFDTCDTQPKTIVHRHRMGTWQGPHVMLASIERK